MFFSTINVNKMRLMVNEEDWLKKLFLISGTSFVSEETLKVTEASKMNLWLQVERVVLS